MAPWTIGDVFKQVADNFGFEQLASDLRNLVTDSGIASVFEQAASDAGNVAGLGGAVVKDTTLGQERYNFNQRTFPSDLGSEGSYNGHYMVINVNVQDSTQFNTLGFNRGSGNISTVLPEERSKTDVLRYNQDKLYSGTKGSFGQGIGSRARFTKRIVESIALYMPSSELTFTDAHDFENIMLTTFAGPIGGGVARFAGGMIGGIRGGVKGAAAGAKLAGDIVGAAGNIIGSTAQIRGTPINPKVEVLYANTLQRQFAFDFQLAPSNKEESAALDNIIRTLRFYAAPEYNSGLIDSFFWTPPSEFDITFYNRGVENTKIPRINTCVLEQIDVSYAPSGVYSTFSNGYPVHTRMMLRFKETEVTHKLRIAQGF